MRNKLQKRLRWPLMDKLQKRLRLSLTDKLKESQGLTFVEMLCAILILSLLSLLINSGLHMAQRSYHSMVLQSETRLLLSTLSDALADELRYAGNVEVDAADGTLKTYRSGLYGEKTTLKVKKDQAVDKEKHGQIYAEAPLPGSVTPTSYLLLPDGAYGGKMWLCGVPADGMKISYDAATKLFTVELKVLEMKREGTDERSFVTSGISAETKFTVRCLNWFDD